MTDTWVKQPKVYSGGAFLNTPFIGVKSIDNKTGKYIYFIGQSNEKGIPIDSTLQQIPSGSYKAIMQFQDILSECPTILKKGEFKLTKQGRLPKALLDALGKDTIAKATKNKVRTLALCEEEMKSWSSKGKKSTAKKTYRR